MTAAARPVPGEEETEARSGAVSLGMLERQAGFVMRIAQLTAFERFFDLLGPSMVKISEITVLIAIEENPGIRQGEIADLLKIKWPKMTKLVRELEDRDLVDRHVPQHDRRSVVLRLTEKGRAAIAQSAPAMIAADRQALSMLDDAEHATLVALSRKIAGWPPASGRG